MIDIKIEGVRKKIYVPTYVGSPVSVAPAFPDPNSSVTCIFIEANRRENVVKNLYKACKYRPGDTVELAFPTEALLEEFGKQLIVLSIADSYVKLGKDEPWKNDDNPLLVHIKSHDKDITFFCTTNFVKKTGIV